MPRRRTCGIPFRSTPPPSAASAKSIALRKLHSQKKLLKNLHGALQYDAIVDRAASVILVHNHPSGNTEPSQEDVAITERLIQAGEILGIKIHDHIIVSNKGYTSMKERGLI
jgi:hypothetical protein